VTRQAPRPLLGIVLVVLAMACFATLDTAAKILSLTVPALMAVWFRYCFQAAAMAAAALPGRGWRVLHTRHPWLHLMRGLLLLSASLLSFFGLKHLPIAEFIAIIMLTPLSLTLVAALFLGERVTGLRWLLVAGGFAGALLVVRPDGESSLGWPLLFAFGCMVANTFFQLVTSRLARTEAPTTLHLSTGLIGTVVMTALLPTAWQPITAWSTWGWLVLSGVMSTLGHFLLIQAFSKAPASSLAPVQYSQMVFGMLAGWLVFHHLPGPIELVGMALIIVCGATSAWLTSRPAVEDAV
jgi:drug/metabolite transporter (DMT)-like permease